MRKPNRYAVLLRLRKQEEDLRAQALAESRNAVLRSQRERTSLELTRQLALEHAGETLMDRFDATEVRSYYQYERHLAVLRDQKDADIRELRTVEAEKLAQLESATKARRVAEKLHDRRWASYREYVGKELQKQMDETATMYAARDREAPSSHDVK